MQIHAKACSGIHHYAPYDIYNQYQNQYQNQNQIKVVDVVVRAREWNAGLTNYQAMSSKAQRRYLRLTIVLKSKT